MDREENNAIFWLKGLENDKEHFVIEERQAITIILNLIDKQQEEIKKLKNDLREERAINIEALNTLKECVHKDRIKEMIKIYKTRKDELQVIFFSKFGKTQNSFTQAVFTEIIRILEEILGENEI